MKVHLANNIRNEMPKSQFHCFQGGQNASRSLFRALKISPLSTLPGLLPAGSPSIFLLVASNIKALQAKATSGLAISFKTFLNVVYKA